jgi:hypothetical protein
MMAQSRHKGASVIKTIKIEENPLLPQKKKMKYKITSGRSFYAGLHQP